MSSPLDSAIAALLAVNATEQAAIAAEPVVTVTVAMVPTPSKAIKAKKIPSPGPAEPSIPGVVMPQRCTIDASAFMVAIRSAGRRIATNVTEGKVTNAPYTDPREVRNDTICAIHAYCGYNPHENFGSQETAARTQAMRDLRIQKVSGGSRDADRAVARSLTGYVAGAPDNVAKRLADLNGRAEAAVERMIDHEKLSQDSRRTQAERELSAGLAAVEKERISAINSDISALVGG